MMAARTLLQRAGVGLWLMATLAPETVLAQNLYVGPGAVVIQQYRPGARFFSPNAYSYAGPNPFIYVPLTGTQVQIYYPPRIQFPAPMSIGGGAIPSNPYQEYYSPHIPRYYRHQDQPEQTETPATPAPQSSATEGPTSRETTPAPGEPERVEQGNVAEPPSAQTEQITVPASDQIRRRESVPGEQSRRPARRKPIRYR